MKIFDEVYSSREMDHDGSVSWNSSPRIECFWLPINGLHGRYHVLAMPNSFEMLYIGIILSIIMLNVMCTVNRRAYTEIP